MELAVLLTLVPSPFTDPLTNIYRTELLTNDTQELYHLVRLSPSWGLRVLVWNRQRNAT